MHRQTVVRRGLSGRHFREAWGERVRLVFLHGHSVLELTSTSVNPKLLLYIKLLKPSLFLAMHALPSHRLRTGAGRGGPLAALGQPYGR